MIAQAIGSIWRFLRSLLHVLGVFFAGRPCVAGPTAAVVNRPHVCALGSEADPGTGLNGLARSRAHGDTSAPTMLSVGDLGPKDARNATLILLREMQRCTDSYDKCEV